MKKNDNADLKWQIRALCKKKREAASPKNVKETTKGKQTSLWPYL